MNTKTKRGDKSARVGTRAIALTPFHQVSTISSIVVQVQKLLDSTNDPNVIAGLKGLRSEIRMAMNDCGGDLANLEAGICIGQKWGAIVANQGFSKPGGKDELPENEYIRREWANRKDGDRKKDVIARGLNAFQRATGKPSKRSVDSFQSHFRTIIGG